MRRRGYLISLGAVVGVTGCSSENGSTNPTPTAPPSATPTPTPTSTPFPETETPTLTESLTNEEAKQQYLDRLEDLLTSAEIRVDFLAYQGGYQRAALDYITAETTQDGIAQEIGTIVGAVVTLFEDGWRIDRLQVGVLNLERILIGRWHILGEWVVANINGEMTDEELAANVLSTLESL